MADHKPNEGSASNPTGGDNFKATARTFIFEGGNLTRDPDVVMRSVLNSIGIGELARTAGTEGILFQSGPPFFEFPLRPSVPNPSFELPMSQFYIKLSQFMKWMQKQMNQEVSQECITPYAESWQYLAVIEQAHEFILKDAKSSLEGFANRLKEVTSTDLRIRSEIQEEIVLSGHVTQQIGALLLELGRILFNFRSVHSILPTLEVNGLDVSGSKTRNFFLGMENAEDQGYGLVPNVDEVILSVLNTLEIGRRPGTASLQGMQFPPQASSLDSLSTISKLFVKVDQAFCDIVPETQEAEAIELNGGPPRRISLVLEQASHLLALAETSFIQLLAPLAEHLAPKQFKKSTGSEPEFQQGRVEHGLAMHHLGVAFLALGRTLSTFCTGQQ